MKRTTCVFLLLLACGDDDGATRDAALERDAGDRVDSGLDRLDASVDASVDAIVPPPDVPPRDAGPIPSVLDDLAPGHWMVLSENVLEDVNPCPDGDCPYRGNSGIRAVMGAWCGAAFATAWGTLGGLVVHGGGHQDYYGSEVYVFDVGTRLWERVSDPFDGGTADCDPTFGSYPDGSPCPGHTYDGVEYDPTTNSFIVLNAERNNLGGSTSGHPFAFDLDTRTWSRGARRLGGSGGTGISSSWDVDRNVMWVLPANGGDFQFFDPSADEWTSYGRSDIAIDAIAAIAPARDLYVLLNTRRADQLEVFDLGAPADDRVVANVSGSASDVLGASKPAMEWDPLGERFVIWIEGPAVYTLEVPADDWRSEPWTFVRVDPAPSNSVDPGEPHRNGTYSRFQYVPAKDVFIVVSATNAPVYAYRPLR